MNAIMKLHGIEKHSKGKIIRIYYLLLNIIQWKH